MARKRMEREVRCKPKQLPWDQLVPEWASVPVPTVTPSRNLPALGDTQTTSELDETLFEVPPSGLTKKERTDAEQALKCFLQTEHEHFAGFQSAQPDESFRERFGYLLGVITNNYGDPFAPGRMRLNTKVCERAVLDYFAALWNAPWPQAGSPNLKKNQNTYWGYVCTLGSTEGSILALYKAREYLRGMKPDLRSPSPNDRPPVLFYSQSTHFSSKKGSVLLDLCVFQEAGRSYYPGQCPITKSGDWPDAVPCHDFDDKPSSGSINIEALTTLVTFFAHRNHPIIVVANMGTTWKGAHDDVPAIQKMFHDLGEVYPWLWKREVQCGFDEQGKPRFETRRGFWLHVDAALGGGYGPFMEMACNRGELRDNSQPPLFDFRIPAVMSLCCSIHKWMGAPFPAAVFMTRRGYQTSMDADSSPDSSTLGASRSSLGPAFLWDYISRTSYEDSIKKVVHCERGAAHFYDEMRKMETEMGVDLWVARSRHSLSVRFRLVNETINRKWSLDTRRYWVPINNDEEQLRSYSHIFVMPTVNIQMLDELLADIRDAASEGYLHAFPELDGVVENPGGVRPSQGYAGVCREPAETSEVSCSDGDSIDHHHGQASAFRPRLVPKLPFASFVSKLFRSSVKKQRSGKM